MGNLFTSQSKFNLRNCKTLAKMCWRGIKQNHFMSIKRVLSFIIFMMGSCYLIFDIICQFRHEKPLLLATLIEMWLFFTFCHRWLAKYLTHKMLFLLEFIVLYKNHYLYFILHKLNYISYLHNVSQFSRINFMFFRQLLL